MSIPTKRLDALDSTINPQRNHEVAAMRDGISNKLRIEQILGLLVLGDLPSEALEASSHTLDTAVADLLGLDPADRNVQKAIEAVAVRTAPQPFTDVASATTTDIGAVDSLNVRITGTTTIAGLGTAAAGVVRRALFAASLTLTHNATSLILPGGDDIVTAAGDVAVFVSLGSGNWRCVDYFLANIAPVYIERGSAKAWANLNGTGTIALRDSLNVSSVVDDATGTYTFNYATSMQDAQYSIVPSCEQVGGSSHVARPTKPLFAASTQINIGQGGVTAQDREIVLLSLMGDLA